MEVEVVSLEMSIVLAFPNLLVERGTGVYGNLVHVLLHHIQHLLRLLRPDLQAGKKQ